MRRSLPRRFGWDAGGTLAGVLAAALCLVALPLAAAILLALPVVLLQALLLERSYAKRREDAALIKAAVWSPSVSA
jgi:hypothetical protein